MPRDANILDTYKSNRCCFSSLDAARFYEALNVCAYVCVANPDWENSYRLSERLMSLGIIEVQLKALL